MTGITAIRVNEVLTEVNAQIEELRKGNPNWDGNSEDYSDAISYCGDLLQYVADEMIWHVYKGDKDQEIVEMFRTKLLKSEKLAEEAVAGLVPFGIEV